MPTTRPRRRTFWMALAIGLTFWMGNAHAQPADDEGDGEGGQSADADEEKAEGPEEGEAAAEEKAPPKESETEPQEVYELGDVLARAKQLHQQGVVLLRGGDPARALDYFRRSRALYPSSYNVANQATCLHRLKRYDEALEVYEELLTRYPDALRPADRAAVGPAMADLRSRVGNLWVSANVPGTVVVDGRERGKLPLDVPIRVLAGERIVRVLMPGYEAYRSTVKVAARERVELDTELQPLLDVGTLRVQEVTGGVADVFVDGARVGATPWEGPLAAGDHLMWIRTGESGSAPTAVTVLEGQITLVRPRMKPLGPEVRLRVAPSTAFIELDGTVAGTGAWAGRLPAGEHRVVAYEDGYHSQSSEFTSQLGGRPVTLNLRLGVDEEHPRWPKPKLGELWLDAFAGYAGGPTIGSGAEADCPDACDGDPMAHGVMVGLRGGFRFEPGVSLELGGGYLWFGTWIDRTARSTFVAQDAEYQVSYQIEDAIAVRGPFVAPGLSYRVQLNDRFALVGRTAVGIYFSVASDDVTGTAQTDGEPVEITVGTEDPQRKVTVFIMPELGGTARVGPIDLGLSLGAAIFPATGPELSNEPFGATENPDPTNPGAVGNAKRSDAIADERAWGLLTLWVPQVTVGYTF